MDIIDDYFDIILKNANELFYHIKDSNIKYLSRLDRNNYKLICYTIICIGECFSRFNVRTINLCNEKKMRIFIENIRNWKFLRNKLVHQFDTFKPDKYWRTNLDLMDEIQKLIDDIKYIRDSLEDNISKKRKINNG